MATRAEELALARREPDGCRRCDLYRDATRTVFGEGRVGARVIPCVETGATG